MVNVGSGLSETHPSTSQYIPPVPYLNPPPYMGPSLYSDSTSTTPFYSMTPQYGYPFVLKQLKGNIRICQGCRGTLRLPDGTIPSPPYDIVISHMERRPFKDTSGTVRTPTRPSAAHYHLKIMCVRIADPQFMSSSLHIPPDIATLLTVVHKQHLLQEFQLQL